MHCCALCVRRVNGEAAGARCTAPVADSLRDPQSLRSDLSDYAFGLTHRHESFTQREQQIAAPRVILRIAELLRDERALEMTGGFAVSKDVRSAPGSHLRVVDGFRQVVRVGRESV